ncbi:MAG: hypothetical protein ACE5G2_12895, partial [Candidatus Krumholzibacteriia bacterium]
MNTPSLSLERGRGGSRVLPGGNHAPFPPCEKGTDPDGPLRLLARICVSVDAALAMRLHRLRQGERFLRLGYAR